MKVQGAFEYHCRKLTNKLQQLVVGAFFMVTPASGIQLLAEEVAAVGNQRPNVLMIIVDDLNDWVEPLGGHPQAFTPAMKKLASRGVTFTNAHCQSPLCNPSRTSMLTSLRPTTTGVYGLNPWFRQIDELKEVVSLPQQFSKNGYRTYTCGKVYHNSWGKNPGPGLTPEFDVWGPPGGPGVMPKKKLIPPTPAGNNPWVDWGVFDHDDAEKGDAKVAQWAVEQIGEMTDEQPFFMTTGFFLPHVPCYVSQRWWDMFPDETLTMPEIPDDDRDDCSPFSWYLHWNLPEPRIAWLRKHDQHRNLVRSYLASIAFVDSQIGCVLDALENSPHANNTIIVLCSDHGFHLGEKGISGKTTLWERSTRVPMIWAGPGMAHGRCDSPVELLDIYPTLTHLVGIDLPDHVEGVSLQTQLQSPETATGRMALCTHNAGNDSIRGQRYRLIHYADGSEELYDLRSDPMEFQNRIADPSLSEVARRLRQKVVREPATLVKNSGGRILERREDEWYWEKQKIDPDRIPDIDNEAELQTQ